MRKVLIPTKLDKAAADKLVNAGYDVVLDGVTPLDEQVKANPDTEVLIVRSEKVTPEVIDQLPKLKLIVRAGAGFNTIDIKYARKRDIDVMNTPGANSNAVAEEVVAMILASCRHLIPADISARSGKWEKSKFMGRELTGKTVGILGLGHIGQLLVARLRGFDVKVLGFDPVLSPALADKLGVELTTVERIFSDSDFVSLHIPENDETRGMINRRLLESMKPGATLINCARCGILNEEDLRAVKAEKKIVYCNDVYPKDVEGPKSVADVADIMLPHLGANTHEANFTAACRAAEQTIAYFEQGINNCVVNKALPDGLDAKFQQLAYVLTKLTAAYLGKENNPTRIETSFYGDLAKYAKWMTPAIVAGINPDFALENGPKDAAQYLNDSGVELNNREVDNNKNYGEAMTIDLFVGGNLIYKAGARGTITENRLMISRLNDFDELYLEPTGNHLFVEYKDEPGVIGKIAGILGEKNINIVDIRAPQDPKSGLSLTVVKTGVVVPDILVQKIREAVNASKAFQFSL
ncbi:MAG: 3-phosphoglycerate dehydrogenase family protein [Victivallaceae bacterium]|nr:3-phosphoglycerate dehydrogenase family protein [Victivallaceae bacterium]